MIHRCLPARVLVWRTFVKILDPCGHKKSAGVLVDLTRVIATPNIPLEVPCAGTYWAGVVPHDARPTSNKDRRNCQRGLNFECVVPLWGSLTSHCPKMKLLRACRARWGVVALCGHMLVGDFNWKSPPAAACCAHAVTSLKNRWCRLNFKQMAS